MSDFSLKHITWKSEYNIGNYKIDSEHQQLFQIAKKALSLLEKKNQDNLDELKDVVKKLFTYVSIHFKHEEEHMKKIDFPDIQRHKMLHNNMTNMLTKLLEDINRLELHEIKVKIYDFIDEYFIKHIILEDKKIRLHETPLDELRKNFGWKDIYKIENDLIDAEHKQLFEIASSAFEVVDSNKRNEKIKMILSKLYNYMKRHFEHEEKFMESIAYENIEEHKRLHKDIISLLNTFVRELPSMEPEFFEKELARLIDITLVEHIVKEDKKIVLWEMSRQ